MIGRAAELYRYRELLGNLVRKELKVKYKNSTLGFLWTMLNPLLYLVIFTVVLGVFLRSGVPWFALYLLSGLLAWNLFSTALSGSTGSIVGNSTLVTKVFFPREILPLASIGASMVHFVLQLLILIAAMLITGYQRFWDAGLSLLPMALVVEILFLAGLGLLLASLNVYMRDVQHLLELALLAWFWMTPIVYASGWVAERLSRYPLLFKLYLANPMTAIVLGFQRALYVQRRPAGIGPNDPSVLVDAPLGWYFRMLGLAGAGALVLLVFAWWLFRRLDGRLAEEL